MRTRVPLSVRIYRVLLHRMMPSLDPSYLDEAVEVFRAAGSEARARGMGAALAFHWREARALLTTSLRERRSLRRGGRGAAPSSGPNRSPGGRDRGQPLLSRIRDVLGQDVRYAVRNLARTPGFVVVSIFSLTFGIAASTILFSIGNAAFLRPLPHAQEPERLVRIFSGIREFSRGPLAYPDLEDIRAGSTTLADVALFRDQEFYIGSAAEASRRTWGLEVSENYFDLLGIPMARGRSFQPDDVRDGGQVAIIGHQLWQRRYGGEPGVLGRTLMVDGDPYTVIGVGPPGMVSPGSPSLLEVVIPVRRGREDRGHRSLTGVARMREGVTPATVQAELGALARNLATAYPDDWGGSERGERSLTALTLRQAMIPDAPSFVGAVAGFLTLVGLILLITCSNVANLLLTRAFSRREEIAVRSAIGAPRRRILAQLLTENLLLFGISGILALLLIHWMVSLASAGWSFLPSNGANFAVDGRVAAFTMAMTLITGLTFGLLPALQASRPNLVPALKGQVVPLRFRRLGIRNLLVGAQVGGSLLFILVTLIFLNALSEAGDLDFGFNQDDMAIATVNFSFGDYQEEGGRRFVADLIQRLESMPEVEGAAVSTWVPMEGGRTHLAGLEPEGYQAGPDEFMVAGMTVVSRGYLPLLEIEILRGRGFEAGDDPASQSVVLASQTFVDRFWPGESGVGRRINLSNGSVLEVVGVVEDVAFSSPNEEPFPHLWFPFEQRYDEEVTLHVRTAGDPRRFLPTIRRVVAELDPDLPIVRVDLMENVTANATLLHRILSAIVGVAGIFALGLAMLGIYGVVAFSVSQRTREVGLRIALGAEPGRVARMVVREGVGVALVGLIPGFAASLVVAQLLRSLLFGMNPFDPVVLGSGVGLILLGVVVASLGPARRAARAHPMAALREE